MSLNNTADLFTTVWLNQHKPPESAQLLLIRVVSDKGCGIAEATMMMIAAGGEAVEIHMHWDLFSMLSSLLSRVCAESSIVRKEVVGTKVRWR